MTFPRKATNADLLATTASHVLAIETVGGKTRGPRRHAIASLSAQLAASGPLADRVNAAATGIVVNSLPKLNAIIAPDLNAKAEIRGSGNPAVDGVYGKSAPAGQAGWTRLADLDSASSAAIAELQEIVDDLDRSKFANLSPGEGNGTVENVVSIVEGVEVTTPTLRLVFTGGYGDEVGEDFQQLFEVPTLNASNPTAEFVTMQVDAGPALPLVPWDDNTKWQLSALPSTGKMFAIKEGDRYRCFSPYGISLPKPVWDNIRKRVAIELGMATVAQNQSGVTIFTWVTDLAPTDSLVDGYNFFGDLPETNQFERAKARFVRSDGREICPPTEFVTAADEQIDAEGLPKGTIWFKAATGPSRFKVLVGNLSFGGGKPSAALLEEILTALSSDDAGENALVRSSRVTQLEQNWAENIAAVEQWTTEARGAVAASHSSVAPGWLGIGHGYATTILVGDLDKAMGALTPPSWAVNSDRLGPYIRVDGAQALSPQQIIANPTVVQFEEGVRYRATFRICRLDDGSNDGDLVRLGVQLMTGQFLAVAGGGQVELYSDKPSVADDVIRRSFTFSYDGVGVDFQLPADARCGRAYGIFNGDTPVTGFVIGHIAEQTASGDGGADVTELTARVGSLEGGRLRVDGSNIGANAAALRGALDVLDAGTVLTSAVAWQDSLDPDVTTAFLDADDRLLGYGTKFTMGPIRGFAWDMTLIRLDLFGGATMSVEEVLDPPSALVLLDGDSRTLFDPDDIENRVASAETKAAAVETRLNRTVDADGFPLSGIMRKERLARSRMKIAMLLGGHATRLSIILPADSKTERSGWVRTFTRRAQQMYGDAGVGTVRLFGGAEGETARFASALDGRVFGDLNDPTTSTADRRTTVTKSAGWTERDPGGSTTVTPADSVMLTSGTATGLVESEPGVFIAPWVTVTLAPGTPTQTSVTLFYVPHAGAACRYRVGLGAWNALNLSSGYLAVLNVQLAVGAALTIEWVSGEVELNAPRGLTGQPGVVVDKVALGGTKLVEHWRAMVASPGFVAQAAHLASDAAYIYLGTNDGSTVDVFGAALDAFIKGLRTIQPWTGQLGLDVGVIAPAVHFAGGGQNMISLGARSALVAEANRCAFVRVQDGFPLGSDGSTAAYAAYWDGGKHEREPFGMSDVASTLLPLLTL